MYRERGADTWLPFSSEKIISSIYITFGGNSGNIRVFPTTITYADNSTWSVTLGRDSTNANVGTLVVFDGYCTVVENRSGAYFTITVEKPATINNTHVNAGGTYTGTRGETITIVFD